MLCLRIRSTTLHSMLPRHSLIKGALTSLPGTAVSLNRANLLHARLIRIASCRSGVIA